MMRAAFAESGVDKPDVVAATVGPGLAGALLVGPARRRRMRRRGTCRFMA